MRISIRKKKQQNRVDRAELWARTGAVAEAEYLARRSWASIQAATRPDPDQDGLAVSDETIRALAARAGIPC